MSEVQKFLIPSKVLAELKKYGFPRPPFVIRPQLGISYRVICVDKFQRELLTYSWTQNPASGEILSIQANVGGYIIPLPMTSDFIQILEVDTTPLPDTSHLYGSGDELRKDRPRLGRIRRRWKAQESKDHD